MQDFPNDHELMGFFEAEPTILDPGVPWIYNVLDFSTRRNGIEVRARITPASGALALSLLLAGHEFALFELRDAESFRIVADDQREALVMTFAAQRGLEDFVLQLRPRVWVSWGNQRFP